MNYAPHHDDGRSVPHSVVVWRVERLEEALGEIAKTVDVLRSMRTTMLGIAAVLTFVQPIVVALIIRQIMET